MPVDYIGFAYAATVAAGGIIGYAKAGMTMNYNIPDIYTLYFFFLYTWFNYLDGDSKL